MKLLVSILVLFLSLNSNAAKKNNWNMEEFLKDYVQRYNMSVDNADLVSKLVSDKKLQNEILAQLKKDKVEKFRVENLSIKGLVLSNKKNQISFKSYKNGFVALNGKNIQVKSGKPFSSYVSEVKSILSKKAFLNLFEPAYASDEDSYALAIMFSSFTDTEKKYLECLYLKDEYDKLVKEKPAGDKELLRFEQAVQVGCVLTNPSYDLELALQNDGNHLASDEITSLECKDGKLSKITTKNHRSYAYNSKDYTLNYLRNPIGENASSLYCSVTFNMECGKSLWFFGSQSCKAVRNERTGGGNCNDTDVGIRNIDTIVEKGMDCCSEYPANVTIYRQPDNSKAQNITQNLCLANLRVARSESGESGEQLRNLLPKVSPSTGGSR